MSIETRFDIPFVAAMALREKQIQQNYRPIIAVHKWFARRPGTLFRGAGTRGVRRPGRCARCFFSANDFPGKRVCDPFMGGGTPLLEANRIGCDVLGFDINPMAPGSCARRSNISILGPTARPPTACLNRSPMKSAGSIARLPALRRQGRAGQIRPLGEGDRLREVRRAVSIFSPATSSPTTPATRRTCWSATNAAS